MEALRGWVMSLAGIVVFASLCEAILPDGNFQKYLRPAMGMLLVITLVSPFPSLLEAVGESVAVLRPGEATTKRRVAEEVQRRDVILVYVKNLEARMLETLQKTVGKNVQRVTCTVAEDAGENFGAVELVLVQICGEPQTTGETAVRECLKQKYGLEKEKVEVQWQRETDGLRECYSPSSPRTGAIRTRQNAPSHG